MTDPHEVDEEENIGRFHCSGNDVQAAQVHSGLTQAKKSNPTVTKWLSASSPQAAISDWDTGTHVSQY